jgi:alpha-2-macroglobulin-like protein
MHTCDQCSDLLLDYLYGLLDEGEARELRDHLAACPACQAALAKAESQQSLIARAAQVYGEVAPFTAPSAAAPAEPAPAETAVQASQPAAPAAEAPAGPATLPLSPPRRRTRRAWAWCAAAAGLVLAAVGLYGSHRYQEGLAAKQDDLRRARKEVDALDGRLARAVADYRDEAAALPARVEAGFLHLRLTGPAGYQRSSPSQYHVTTRTPDGKLAPATLTVRLLDPLHEGGPLFEKRVESRGEQTLTLPAGLEVGPDSLPLLEVEARRGEACARLEQLLAVPAPGYATHLVTNKPAYRAGEILFFRSLTLDRFSLKPPERELRLTFTLLGPHGATGRQLDAQTAHGIAGGEFAVTPDLPEGEYTLQVTAASAQGAEGRVVLPAARRLVIARDESPQLRFDRPQYAPGESGVATFRGRLQPGGLPTPNQPVTAQANLNGQPLPLQGNPPGRPVQLLTDRLGKAEIPFQVPATTEAKKGEVRVEVQVHDGLQNEKVAQNVPVVPRPAAPPVTVEFFPEGGDLVAGLPARVYFLTRNARGEPVAVEGSVVDAQGHEVAPLAPAGGDAKSEGASGAGVFTFTPAAGQSYALKVRSPKGLKDPVALPAVKPEGVGLSVPSPVGREGGPVRVHVRASRPGRALLVVASCRGRLVDQRELTAGPDGSVVELRPVAGTRGVVCVAVCELRQGQLVPLAERLVYQAPAESLVLSVPSKPGQGLRYPPGSHVDLTARVKTAAGKPTPGWLLAAVVDQNALQARALRGPAQTASSPSRAARILTDLEEAELLLTGVAQSREALDLFLGTHVEGRFAPPGRPGGAGLDAKEALARAREGVPAVLLADNGRKEVEDYQHALAERQEERRRQAERERDRLEADRPARVEEARLAALELSRYESEWRGYLQAGAVSVLGALFAVSAVFLTVGLGRLLRGGRSSAPAFAFASVGLVLCACLMLLLPGGLFPGGETPGGGRDAAQAAKRWDLPDLQRGPGQGPRQGREARPGELYALAGPDQAREEKALAEGEKAKGGALGASDRSELRTPNAAKGDSEFARHGEAKSKGKAALGKQTTGPSKEYALRYRELAQVRRDQPPQPAVSAPTKGGGKGGAKIARPVAPGFHPGGMSGGGFGGQDKASGDKKEGDKKKFEKGPGNPVGGGVFVLRPYAHQHVPGTLEYQDTVFWHPALFAADGTARLQFDLSSASTTYRLLLFGHDGSGRLGAFHGKLQAAE